MQTVKILSQFPVEEKTLLKIEVPKTICKDRNTISVNVYNRLKFWIFDDATEEYQQKRKTYSFGSVSDRATEYNDGKATEYFQAVICKYAPLFVYTNLKTIYAKNPVDKIRLLMNECIAIANSAGYKAEEYNDYLELYHDELFAMPCLLDENLSDIDKILKGQDKMQYGKLHTYKMVKNGNKRYKVLVEPYVTLENTAKGKHLLSIDNIPEDLDASDLMQEASLAIVNLLRFGLIEKVSDVFNYSSYIYYAINQLIDGNKKRSKKEIAFDVAFQNKGKLAKSEKAIENESVSSSIVNFVYNKLPKKCNRANTIYTFVHCILNGETEQTTANMLGIDQRTIANYKRTIASIISANADEIRKLIV